MCVCVYVCHKRRTLTECIDCSLYREVCGCGKREEPRMAVNCMLHNGAVLDYLLAHGAGPLCPIACSLVRPLACLCVLALPVAIVLYTDVVPHNQSSHYTAAAAGVVLDHYNPLTSR